MGKIDDDNGSAPKLSRAQEIAQKREAYRLKQKERAKEARKAYLAKPEVQEKLKSQKEKLKARRKEKSAQLKAAKKQEKISLEESRRSTRERRQEKRDQELAMMLGRGSELSDQKTKPKPVTPPTLTLIKGGKANCT